MINRRSNQNLQRQTGFSLPELIVVLLILAIIVAIALPQIISSRQLFSFTNLQRQIGATIRDARQEAMTQRKPITVRYDDSQRQLIVYGGGYGVLNDTKNQIVRMDIGGLGKANIVYGRPPGSLTGTLSDGVNLNSLNGGKVEFTFQSDGSILNASGNPENFGLAFYHNKYQGETAFAVTILGAGGRVKLWRYNKGTKNYVE